MLELWSLLALLAAVAAGLVTATVASLLVRSRQTAFFRAFLVQILLFNLLILGGLTLRYLELHFRQEGLQSHPALMPGLLGIMAILKAGWLYAFTAMMLLLPGQDLPSWFGPRLVTALAGLLAVWGAALAVSMASGRDPAVQGLLGGFELVILGGAAWVCLDRIARRESRAGGARSRRVALLSGAYLAIFLVMLGSLALGWSSPTGPDRRQVLFNSAFMILYNLLPLAWLLRYQPTGPVRASADLERFGITRREGEIIALICSGRTNQEIADQLFISPATVKDHNYNIFRKTGVRNRVELVNLMREGGEEGQASSGKG